MARIIGIDLGTSSVKALLLEDGAIIDSKSASYTPDYPDQGFVEQDPAIWWDSTVKVLKALIDANPSARGNIAAIACSGQMHSSVFLDSNNDVVRKAILWNDTRTAKQTKDILKAIGGEAELLKHVYNRSLEGFTLPKILWLRDNEPENFRKTKKVIMPKDYINFMLTGKIATEVSDAAGTILLDVKSKQWSAAMLKALDLDPGLLPEVLESTDVVGNVKEDLAKSLGTGASKVVAGGADNSCAAIGNGLVKEGQTVISVGTSGTVVSVLEDIRAEVTGDVHLFNYSAKGKYYAMGCMLSAGDCLSWLKSILSGSSFKDFDQMAEAAPPGSKGLIFLPYLSGERCPFSDPDVRGVFFGLSAHTKTNEMVRAVLEGVAFNIRAMFELVSSFTEIGQILITGGGAASPIWRQIIADVLNRPLSVLNIEEGPAFGAAMIAAVGAGLYDSFEAAEDGLLKTVIEVVPQPNPIYENQYKVFTELYAQTKQLFPMIHQVR